MISNSNTLYFLVVLYSGLDRSIDSLAELYKYSLIDRSIHQSGIVRIGSR